MWCREHVHCNAGVLELLLGGLLLHGILLGRRLEGRQQALLLLVALLGTLVLLLTILELVRHT